MLPLHGSVFGAHGLHLPTLLSGGLVQNYKLHCVSDELGTNDWPGGVRQREIVELVDLVSRDTKMVKVTSQGAKHEKGVKN